MARITHVRKQSSIDQFFEEIQGLDDTLAEDLLRDLNHTTTSNVPVNEGIGFFEDPDPNSRRRRRSTFLKSVSNFDLRTTGRPGEDAPPLPSPPRARSASATPHKDGEDADARRHYHGSDGSRYRAYKRISRPWHTPSSRDLLMAYLTGSTGPSPPPMSSASSSYSSSGPDSPTTPRTASSSALFFSPMVAEPEDLDAPGLDLLEPSPARKPRCFTPTTPGGFPSMDMAMGGMGGLAAQPGEAMISGIFEVLSSES